MATKNIACRIFKEQLDLIKQLPEEDRPAVLYNAIMQSFNQFENQTENQTEKQFEIQFENQNEYAYISSSLSISIINLLSKNIVFKEYNNYGGKRENSGRTKKQTDNQNENQNEKNKIEWIGNKIPEKVYIDAGFFFLDNTIPEFKDMTDQECEKAYHWIKEKMNMETLSREKFISVVRKFKGDR